MFNVLTILSDLSSLTGLASDSPYLAVTVCVLAVFAAFMFMNFAISFLCNIFHL